MYGIWVNVTSKSGTFAGFSQRELVTYVFGAVLLHTVVMGMQSREAATEINDGTFSSILIKPVNYFLYVFFRELPERFLSLIASLIALAILFLLLHFKIIVQTNPVILLIFGVSVLFATVLYYLFSFVVSLFAFWSREANGPRYLLEWILEFASGEFFPLQVLLHGLFIFLSVLPFAYIIYYPVIVYLGKTSFGGAGLILLVQIFWIGVMALITRFVWKAGLRKFTAEGI